jgi:hypothetical protein
MKKKPRTFWRRRARAATLVEALAGTLLLGTVLTGILIARGQLTVQARRADDRTDACAMLDDLLEAYWPARNDLPVEDAGDVPGHAGWRWRRREVARSEAEAFGGQIVAVEVFAPDAADAEPAARVELLVTPQDAAPAKEGGQP